MDIDMDSILVAHRDAIYGQMRGILEGATGNNLSPDERRRYDTLAAEFHAANNEITRMRTVIRSQQTRDAGRLDNTAGPDGFGGEQRLFAAGERMAERRSSLSIGRTIRALAAGGVWEQAPEERAAMGIDTDGSALIPTQLVREFFDLARGRSVVTSAGAKTLIMTASEAVVPKLARDVIPMWRDEHAPIAIDQPAFTPVTLRAKSLAVITKISRELLADSPIAEEALRDVIGKAFAAAFDGAALLGTGVGPVPLGIRNTPGIPVIYSGGANGGPMTNYDPLVRAKGTVLAANRTPGSYVLASREATALAMMKNTGGDYLVPPAAVTEMKAFVAANMPTNEVRGTSTDTSSIIVGDFATVLIGLREAVSLHVLVERFADTGDVGLAFHLRGDVAVLDTAAFCIIAGIKPQ